MEIIEPKASKLYKATQREGIILVSLLIVFLVLVSMFTDNSVTNDMKTVPYPVKEFPDFYIYILHLQSEGYIVIGVCPSVLPSFHYTGVGDPSVIHYFFYTIEWNLMIFAESLIYVPVVHLLFEILIRIK